jgi:hypothetical protein
VRLVSTPPSRSRGERRPAKLRVQARLVTLPATICIHPTIKVTGNSYSSLFLLSRPVLHIPASTRVTRSYLHLRLLSLLVLGVGGGPRSRCKSKVGLRRNYCGLQIHILSGLDKPCLIPVPVQGRNKDDGSSLSACLYIVHLRFLFRRLVVYLLRAP